MDEKFWFTAMYLTKFLSQLRLRRQEKHLLNFLLVELGTRYV